MTLFKELIVQRGVKNTSITQGEKMKLKNKIFAILAIFCLIASTCAVSAADDVNDTFTDDMYNGYPTETPDMPDLNATDDNSSDLDAEAIHDSMVLPPDYAHSEMNATNATGHTAGENVTTTNTTNATQAHTLPATGNPILALLAVGAVLGGAEIYRRRK